MLETLSLAGNPITLETLGQIFNITNTCTGLIYLSVSGLELLDAKNAEVTMLLANSLRESGI
jgi:hypothetical protein